MSVIQKIILWFLCLTLIPVLLTGGLIYAGFSRSIKQKALEQLEYIATIQEHRTEDALHQNQERLEGLTSRYILPVTLDRYNSLHKPEDRDLLNRSLDGVQSQIASFRYISLLNPKGSVVASTLPSDIGSSYANRDYFIEGSQRSNVTSFFFTDNQGALRVHLVGPLLLQNKLVGVVVIDSDAQNVLANINDYTGLGQTGETALAKQDSNGDAIFLAPLRFDANAALQRRISHTNTKEPIVQAVNGHELTITDAIDYRGHAVLAVTRHIKDVNWGLSAKIDQAEAYKPVAQLRDTLLMLIFIILVLGVFVALFAARLITEPILILSNAANEMSKGNLKQRVNFESEDEIGTLGKAFNTMADNLDKLDQMKAEFISLTSHQLRTPATAVKGFINMLLEGYSKPVTAKQRELLTAANEENERQLHLINDILEISRADSEKMTLSKSEVDLNNIIKNVFDQQLPIFESHHQKLIFKPEKPTIINADAEKIRMVVENLISNAGKYSPDHTEVKASISQDEKTTRLEIKDQGYGIAVEDTDKLFKKFSRLSNPNSVKAQGSGLGLYLVKKIVELHGGNIEVESNGSSGTTFIVQLPNK